jgi:hypothetical protein
VNAQDKFFGSPQNNTHFLALGGSGLSRQGAGLMFFDPKGDSDITVALQFLTKGQRPFGEWLKRLSAKDRPPRGRCQKYFSKHQNHRRKI